MTRAPTPSPRRPSREPSAHNIQKSEISRHGRYSRFRRSGMPSTQTASPAIWGSRSTLDGRFRAAPDTSGDRHGPSARVQPRGSRGGPVGQTERGGSDPAADALDRRGDDSEVVPHDLDAQTKTNPAGLHRVDADPSATQANRGVPGATASTLNQHLATHGIAHHHAIAGPGGLEVQESVRFELGQLHAGDALATIVVPARRDSS